MGCSPEQRWKGPGQRTCAKVCSQRTIRSLLGEFVPGKGRSLTNAGRALLPSLKLNLQSNSLKWEREKKPKPSTLQPARLTDRLLLRAEHAFRNFIPENSSVVLAGAFQANFTPGTSSLGRLQRHAQHGCLHWEAFGSFCCVSSSEVFVLTVCKCEVQIKFNH